MSFDFNTPQIIPLPEICDERGVKVLGFIEHGKNCPFPIERVYYMHDFPVGVDRGHHSHHKCHRLLVALSGNVEVELELGGQRFGFVLDHPGAGLFVPAPSWIVYRGLDDHSVLMAIASEKFDEADYIRDYEEFKRHDHSSQL
jgi:hypothetical protein